MCKHAAATLYGAGARFDAAPDLLFALRGVDRAELIRSASADLPMTRRVAASERVLVDDDVAALFGIEFASAPGAPRTTDKKKGRRRKARRWCKPRKRRAPVIRTGRRRPPVGERESLWSRILRKRRARPAHSRRQRKRPRATKGREPAPMLARRRR